jgi:hypothetical protein
MPVAVSSARYTSGGRTAASSSRIIMRVRLFWSAGGAGGGAGWAREVVPLDVGRKVFLVPGAAVEAADPAADTEAPAATPEFGSYNSMVLASRAKFEGSAPGPRRGRTKYRPSRVGLRDTSSVVDQESGSSAEEMEARAHARAAQRSLSSFGGVLDGDDNVTICQSLSPRGTVAVEPWAGR